MAATAYPHRKAPFNILLLGSWDEPSETEQGLRWVNEFWEGIKPYLGNRVYVNYMGIGEADRVRSAYGDNYERLAAVKSKYDPANFFQNNQNMAAKAV